MSLRESLQGKSFDERWKVGLDVLRRLGILY